MTDNHVTYRGSMKDTNIIQLPAEWKGKVDLETISVSLTPIATYRAVWNEAEARQKKDLQLRGLSFRTSWIRR